MRSDLPLGETLEWTPARRPARTPLDGSHVLVRPVEASADAESPRPTTIGRDCVVGHLVHLEGVLVEDAVLIGSASTVLEEACVRTGAMVAAGALVLSGTEVMSGRRAQGVPAELVACDVDVERIRAGARTYRELARRYRDGLKAIG